MKQSSQPAIWTIGHSNQTGEALLELLSAHGVEQVADVRRFPGSRRFPQFGGEELAQALAQRAITYIHLAALGGWRGRPAPDTPNTGWRVAQFAAYADYMQSDAFEQALQRLQSAARGRRTAMMCAEAVPWRCHRRLIADALVVAGWQVRDIMGPGAARLHRMTPFARVIDGRLVYPAQAD